MQQVHGLSITNRIAIGPQQGRKVFTLQTLLPKEADDDRFSQVAKAGGFSLHAGVAVRPNDRKKLEHLCRYVARPAVSEQPINPAAFPPTTGSEDVHVLLGPHTRVPFMYLIVGVAYPAIFAVARKEGKVMPYSGHNPNFVVDLQAIPVGARIAAVAMLELLAKRVPK